MKYTVGQLEKMRDKIEGQRPIVEDDPYYNEDQTMEKREAYHDRRDGKSNEQKGLLDGPHTEA